MKLPPEFIPKDMPVLNKEDYETCFDHQELSERLRKTLYYGRAPSTDRPSLPVTEIAVEFFQEAAPRGLGRVDTLVASNMGRRACMSPCSMMLGIIYIDRLKHRNPEYLKNVSSSDLFLISMMVASKYLYDEGVDEEVFNDEWAESAKMEVDELNELERNFLAAIDWNLYTKAEDFFLTLNRVEQRIAKEKGLQRGFFTYTDLFVLAEDGQLYRTLRQLLAEICTVLVVCSVAYIAGALTMIGSTVSLVYMKQLPTPSLISTSQPLFQLGADQSEMSMVAVDNSAVDLDNRAIDLELDLNDTVEEQVKGLAELSPGEVLQQQMSAIEGPRNALKSTGRVGRQRRPVRKKSREQKRAPTEVEEGGEAATLRVPGFLTLVMLKDTILQFVSAVHTTYKDGGSEDEADVAQDLICTCGCCTTQGNDNRRCYNISAGLDNGAYGSGFHGYTVQGQSVLGLNNLGEWWQLSRLRSSFTDHGKSGYGTRNSPRHTMRPGCNLDFNCQCCCPTGEQPVLSTVFPRFHDVAMGYGTTASPVAVSA